MMQKFAPLIILAMFAIGAYFMVHSMHTVSNMTTQKRAN